MENHLPEILSPDPNQTGPIAAEPAVGRGSHAARLSRVVDYQAQSLGKPDALQANLGSLNSGLMRIALNLDEALEQALSGGPRTVERVQKLLPAIETHLRVARQVDRFAQLEMRSEMSRQPKPSDKAVVNVGSSPPAQ
jgi:hypothetical protein